MHHNDRFDITAEGYAMPHSFRLSASTASAVLLTGLLGGCAGMAPGATDTSSRLDSVQKTALLRICTPGDYKPFAFHKADGSYEGIDVDLMTGLATSLGAKPQWVKTKWADLVPAMVAGQCDIAAGGVSVTTERQKKVFFSAPYMVNGKTPLVRCADVGKYQSVAAIDRPDVRVVYNPGGSNERFAKANFKQAKITQHGENITIFDELLAKRADVFVTESAEAIVQQRETPGLCAVNPDKPLQYGEMGWMLPQGDVAFKAYVDQWLHLSQAGGEFRQVMSHWLK